jgi:hypothetical protein
MPSAEVTGYKSTYQELAAHGVSLHEKVNYRRDTVKSLHQRKGMYDELVFC